MLFIISGSHWAPFNIASEEHNLRTYSEDVFLLYRNQPSIIVGRHQNTLAEINLDYVRQHSIPVVRRLTGGGTVFHDLGNLNYCFIVQDDKEDSLSFARFTAPVLSALRELGVDARLEGRNDLTINGAKFSGNAKALHYGKIHQHGTILFASRIADLSQALRVNPLKFQDKAVKSVASRVTNVSSHLAHPLSLEDFILLISKHVRQMYPDAREHSFSEEENQAIRELVQSKYDTWDWNYGHSPAYNHVKAVRCAAGTIEFHTDVHGGRITGLRVYGDFFSDRDPRELEQALIGLPHRRDDLLKVLQDIPLRDYLGPVTAGEVLSGLI